MAEEPNVHVDRINLQMHWRILENVFVLLKKFSFLVLYLFVYLFFIFNSINKYSCDAECFASLLCALT